MNDTAITLTKAPDFTGLRLTQSETGHVHSPWFTFDWHRGWPGEEAYDIGGKYHEIQYQAKCAFAEILGVHPRDVMVTEMKNHIDPMMHNDRWWRLGTKHPCALPRPLAIDPTSELGVIDI